MMNPDRHPETKYSEEIRSAIKRVADADSIEAVSDNGFRQQLQKGFESIFAAFSSASGEIQKISFGHVVTKYPAQNAEAIKMLYTNMLRSLDIEAEHTSSPRISGIS